MKTVAAAALAAALSLAPQARADDHDVHYDRQFYGRDREVVRSYYIEEHRDGRCPPGLAKMHDGCMPPGHARKWALGKPLPPDAAYHEVPRELVRQIGLPPKGYKYVRVGGDILMIVAGSTRVVDAIEDLGR